MKGLNFEKVSAEDLENLRSSLPERGIKISLETMVIREAIEKLGVGEALKIQIKDWEETEGPQKKKSKIYERIMPQIKWYNDRVAMTKVLGYLNADRNILAIEKLSILRFGDFINPVNGRFSLINYRLGKETV